MTTGTSPPRQVRLHRVRNPGDPFTLTLGDRGEIVDDVADEWGDRIRERARWRGVSEVELDAQKALGRLGVEGEAIAALAGARHVEVEIECTFDDLEALARVPWEALLTLGTARERYGRSLTITRYWHALGAPPSHPSPPDSVSTDRLLFVSSAPGRLSSYFDFGFEQRLVLGTEHRHPAVEPLRNPSLGDLESALGSRRAGVVHLTGFDPRQAWQEGATFASQDPHGFLVRTTPSASDDALDAELVGPEQLADAIEGGGAGVVTCNLRYSAGPICLQLLKRGIRYAVGLQDELDDATAEMFFAEFYRAWRGEKAALDRIHSAFVVAVERVHDTRSARMRGGGIVLWTIDPAVARSTPPVAHPSSAAPGRPAAQPDGEHLPEVDVEHSPVLRYALLHNGISPFRKFRLLQPEPDMECTVTVEISLHDGAPGRAYMASFRANRAVLDLRDDIHVPLDARLLLSASRTEATRALLSVRVSAGPHVLLHRSYPVSLAPVNEWAYKGQWTGAILPSFVLPFDPVVRRIVAASLPALRVLSDDPKRGFLGYDVGGVAEEQARALWHTLISSYALNYITAPPEAHLETQRLRLPSEVISGQQGTCIDLALLFAALLEHVGLRPVIVLTKDHALVGYWSSREAHASFVNVTGGGDKHDRAGQVSAGQIHAWEVKAHRYPEISRRAGARELVLLEPTGIAMQMSFSAAAARGADALQSGTFRALLDIQRARERRITPLPIVFDAHPREPLRSF